MHGASVGLRRGTGRSPENVKRCFRSISWVIKLVKVAARRRKAAKIFKKIC